MRVEREKVNKAKACWLYVYLNATFSLSLSIHDFFQLSCLKVATLISNGCICMTWSTTFLYYMTTTPHHHITALYCDVLAQKRWLGRRFGLKKEEKYGCIHEKSLAYPKKKYSTQHTKLVRSTSSTCIQQDGKR